eukprot:1261343-Heterocapsa_arctica.AAC.1
MPIGAKAALELVALMKNDGEGKGESEGEGEEASEDDVPKPKVPKSKVPKLKAKPAGVHKRASLDHYTNV